MREESSEKPRPHRRIAAALVALLVVAALGATAAYLLASRDSGPSDVPSEAPTFATYDEGEERLVANAERPESEDAEPREAREDVRRETAHRAARDGVVSSALDAARSSTARVGQRGRKARNKRKKTLRRFAVLEIVTDFSKADVTVNGQPYPELPSPEDKDGVLLPAGGPHNVQVTFDGKTKTYILHLRPYETRVLVVELSGLGKASVKRSTPRRRKREEDDADEKDKSEVGRITIYSKPRAAILIDGKSTGKSTPNTVKVDPGRHEVQVKFRKSDAMSEKKIVRVRKGSRIKLFFREKGKTSAK
jgi:hypothetical protein